MSDLNTDLAQFRRILHSENALESCTFAVQMPQRKNNTGRSSGPFKKPDSRKPASGGKKSGYKPEPRGYAGKGTADKSKSRFNSDPNELAPPRFLPPRDSKPAYGRKDHEGRKTGDTGGRGRGPEKDARGSKPEGGRPYKGRTSGGSETGSFRSGPKKPFSGSGDRPYRGKDAGDGGTRRPPYKRPETDGGGNAPFKKRETAAGDQSFRKGGFQKSGPERSDRPAYKDRDGDTGKFRKDGFQKNGPDRGDRPAFKSRDNDAGTNRTGGFKKSAPDRGDRPAYKSRDNDAGDFRKGGFKKDGTDKREQSGMDEKGDKPFRPKYDPEVKLKKKNYTERKKELLGVKDEPDDIRLNKYIANSGVCSRREADDLIKQGLVSVNGTVMTEMGYRVKKTDLVRYDGQKILPEPFVYILMNKPKDFITTTDDEKGRKTVMDLLADKIPQRVYPIGRLDRNTTGVLLLTNDGEVAQALTHPSFQIKKVYHVVLDKKVNGTDLDKLVEGVELEDGKVHADAAAFVDSEDKRHVGVEIHSGRNRVVRRMFEHLGYDVEKLDRVSMGIFTKKDLPRGKWRFLKESEIGFLMKLKANMP